MSFCLSLGVLSIVIVDSVVNCCHAFFKCSEGQQDCPKLNLQNSNCCLKKVSVDALIEKLAWFVIVLTHNPLVTTVKDSTIKGGGNGNGDGGDAWQ